MSEKDRRTYGVVLKDGPANRDMLRRESRWAWPDQPSSVLHVNGVEEDAIRGLWEPKEPNTTSALLIPIVKHVYRVAHVDYVYEYLGAMRDGKYVP